MILWNKIQILRIGFNVTFWVECNIIFVSQNQKKIMKDQNKYMKIIEKFISDWLT